MPALDLALSLGVIRCAPDMLDAPAVEPFGEIAGDVRGTIVGQQPRAVDDRDLIEPGGRQRQVERLSDIGGPHRGAELPGDDEAREVVEHGREIVPPPAGDLQVKSVCQSWLGAVVLSRNSSAALITI